MADEKEEFEETSDPELLDDETETEWVGEEEWGDEEEENVALVEEEVPAFVDNGDGTHTLTILDSDGREYKSVIK